MIDIEKIEAAALAATQGEWIHQPWGNEGSDVQIKDGNVYTTLAANCTGVDADFIAAANPSAVLELIEMLKAAELMVGAKQAQIDELMLEYCPEEMSREQTEEWAKHQKPVKAQA